MTWWLWFGALSVVIYFAIIRPLVKLFMLKPRPRCVHGIPEGMCSDCSRGLSSSADEVTKS